MFKIGQRGMSSLTESSPHLQQNVSLGWNTTVCAQRNRAAAAATSIENVHNIYIVSKRFVPDVSLHQGWIDLVYVNQIKNPLPKIASCFQRLHVTHTHARARTSPNLHTHWIPSWLQNCVVRSKLTPSDFLSGKIQLSPPAVKLQ